jgi:hypothetical protein
LSALTSNLSGESAVKADRENARAASKST